MRKEQAGSAEIFDFSAESLPVVQNGLLRKEHVEYCLAWQKKIGPQEKVLYYGMGADISTPLLTTNAKTIVAFRPGESIDSPGEYIKRHWEFIDQKLTPESYYTSGKLGKRVPVAPYIAPKEDTVVFEEDVAFRRHHGYWRSRLMNRFGYDRFFVMELKKLGVRRDSIKVSGEGLPHPPIVQVDFSWAFPGEKSQRRSVYFVSGIHDEGLKPLFRDVDCYYHKGIHEEKTLHLVQKVQPLLKPEAVVAVGYWFDHPNYSEERPGINERFAQNLGIALGPDYKQLRPFDYYDSQIDRLWERRWEKDKENWYGMKMHIFQRRGSEKVFPTFGGR